MIILFNYISLNTAKMSVFVDKLLKCCEISKFSAPVIVLDILGCLHLTQLFEARLYKCTNLCISSLIFHWKIGGGDQ